MGICAPERTARPSATTPAWGGDLWPAVTSSWLTCGKKPTADNQRAPVISHRIQSPLQYHSTIRYDTISYFYVCYSWWKPACTKMQKREVGGKPIGGCLRRARKHARTYGRTGRKHNVFSGQWMGGGGIKIKKRDEKLMSITHSIRGLSTKHKILSSKFSSKTNKIRCATHRK